MEKALQDKRIEREKGIAIRNALTRALQTSSENERMHGHAYSNYTDLIYKTVFGKSAKQMRTELGVAQDENIRNFLPKDALAKVETIERIVSGLLDCSWDYGKIKSFIAENGIKMIA